MKLYGIKPYDIEDGIGIQCRPMTRCEWYDTYKSMKKTRQTDQSWPKWSENIFLVTEQNGTPVYHYSKPMVSSNA